MTYIYFINYSQMETGRASLAVTATAFGINAADTYFVPTAGSTVEDANLTVDGNLSVKGDSTFALNISAVGDISAADGSVALQLAGANSLPSIVFSQPGKLAAIGYDASNNNLLLGFGTNPTVGVLGGLNTQALTKVCQASGNMFVGSDTNPDGALFVDGAITGGGPTSLCTTSGNMVVGSLSNTASLFVTGPVTVGGITIQGSATLDGAVSFTNVNQSGVGTLTPGVSAGFYIFNAALTFDSIIMITQCFPEGQASPDPTFTSACVLRSTGQAQVIANVQPTNPIKIMWFIVKY